MIVKHEDTTWQTEFVARVAPVVDRWARIRFSSICDSDNRADLIQNSICLALKYYVRLCERGRESFVTPSCIARRAVQHTAAGRRFGARQRKFDALHYTWRAGGMELLQLADTVAGDEYKPVSWLDALVSDFDAPDQVATVRIDFSAWLATLTPKQRAIAKALADREATKDVAERFGLSWGRISQLRRLLVKSYETFQAQAIALQASA